MFAGARSIRLRTDRAFEPFQLGRLLFTQATTPEELDQVHRLNHETFVREIGQYEDDGSGCHVDKFVHKNVYLVCKLNGDTVGMIAVHDQPPFSVTSRLEKPEVLRQLCSRPLEVRLLAVRPVQRYSAALTGLLYSVYRYGNNGGYSHLVISGITEQLELYEKMGFRAIGPPRKSGRGNFVPMVLALNEVAAARRRMAARIDDRLGKRRVTESRVGELRVKEPRVAERQVGSQHQERSLTPLLPGPPRIAAAVRAAFEAPAQYHRGREFISVFEEVRERLGALAGGKQVALLNGSGTLANDATAAWLAADASLGLGLVLINGEFGKRLADQASRAGLAYRGLSWNWGDTWDLEEVESVLVGEPDIDWVWAVHLESSTGILNDAGRLVELAARHGCQVFLDAVSSVGAVPIPAGVALATGVSGKSLGSYPGVAFVCAEPGALAGADSARLPSYLDLPRALATTGPCYTFPSAVVWALHRALDDYRDGFACRRRHERYARIGRHVRRRLRELGIDPLASEESAAPVITTFAPPAGYDSEQFVAVCRSWGYELAGDGRYLGKRGYVQIGTMGDTDEAMLDGFFVRLEALRDGSSS